jgi:hypothetical protein
MTQHAGLTVDRWSHFSLDQQILTIGNEFNRARRLLADGSYESVRLAYERALRLTDLTISVNQRPTLRRELLRWREVVAALYLERELDPEGHDAAFRCLLQMTPAASRQIGSLLG